MYFLGGGSFYELHSAMIVYKERTSSLIGTMGFWGGKFQYYKEVLMKNLYNCGR